MNFGQNQNFDTVHLLLYISEITVQVTYFVGAFNAPKSTKFNQTCTKMILYSSYTVLY